MAGTAPAQGPRGEPHGRLRGARGFTLIELLVVMLITVLLAGISLVVYNNSIVRAKEATLKEDLFQLRNALDQYYADKNRYPASLDELVTDKYIRAVPVDPFTNSRESWRTEMSEPDPGNPSAEPGVYDVKSGSDQTALDGTPYSEW